MTDLPCHRVHTLVLGSGAAGLNSAVQLHARGINDLLILTEGLDKGTSINTGSDKQTYYKLGMYGGEADSPEDMAQSFFSGGSMHGDLAMVEAALSPRAFFHLVGLGVEFPTDRYGQFVGYKTDHDPRQRATSVGPYTSREMCRKLIEEVERRGIAVTENRVCVAVVTVAEEGGKRAAGVVCVNCESGSEADALEVYCCENLVFATGGPGGIYGTSVYPEVHTGGIGLALLAGARAQNLPESQYGMASVKFRWNVSGTYMQVMPCFISTAADGQSDEQEFLLPWFERPGLMNDAVFLKGYQWPFDPRKAVGGSSLVDILVHIETAIKGRRVFMDFRRNSTGFALKELAAESYEYLKNSDALLDTPIERLRKMNQPAVDLYMDHGIDIAGEPLEIAVCAQHNNGGLAGNVWWESVNVKRLFPVGEVNGSHGVYRPGGSALNSGQVAGFRAAEYIANQCREFTVDSAVSQKAADDTVGQVREWLGRCSGSARPWQEECDEFKTRMSLVGAHIRSAEELKKAVIDAREQWAGLEENGCAFDGVAGMADALRTRQLCFSHRVYLDALLFAVESGVGSRGSALVLSLDGKPVHDGLDDNWKFAEEDDSFRDRVLETVCDADGSARSEWVPRRELPASDAWFETAWSDHRQGRIYDE